MAKLLIFCLSALFILSDALQLDPTLAQHGGQGNGDGRGPRDINQCTCHKSCNKKNDICYNNGVCEACILNGTVHHYDWPAPVVAYTLELEEHSKKCPCHKTCNQKNDLCYNEDGCKACLASAPSSSSTKVHSRKCTCQKLCNVKNKLCFNAEACSDCVESFAKSKASTPESFSEKQHHDHHGDKCSCRKSCNPKHGYCFNVTACTICVGH